MRFEKTLPRRRRHGQNSSPDLVAVFGSKERRNDLVGCAPRQVVFLPSPPWFQAVLNSSCCVRSSHLSSDPRLFATRKPRSALRDRGPHTPSAGPESNLSSISR